MTLQRVFSNGRFTLLNTLGLSLLCVYFWIRQGAATTESIIHWPGAYFLSLWILSPIALLFFNSTHLRHKKKFLTQTALGSLVFGLLHFVLTGMLILLLERLFQFKEHFTIASLSRYPVEFWHYFIDGALWYWGYAAILLIALLYQRLTEERQKNTLLRNELTTSDLTMLQRELNPHFLFNAMNSIAMKVRLGENKLAVSMIASLNDLLRAVLSMKKEKSIPLSEELELLTKYLLIEQARFEDQVTIQQEFSDEILKAQVPQMILQPLVENAFKHGIRENLNQQRITISGQKENNSLILSVYNTSATHYRIMTGTNANGIGLQNVIMRLQRQYGTNFQFQSFDLESGIAFKIAIPYQLL